MINEAAADPTGSAATSLNVLKTYMANLHAGEQSYMILPSDAQESTNNFREFEIEFLGINGSQGKMFSTRELIDSRHKDILNTLGCGFMVLGMSGGGSMALGEISKSTAGSMLTSRLNYYAEVFNRELIPQLLAINGIKLSEEDMISIDVRLAEDTDADTYSKVIQRAAAVKYLPRNVEIVNEMLEKLGFDYRLPDDTTPEQLAEMFPSDTPASKSGSGMVEGLPNGQGKSTGSSGDASTGNAEHN